MLKKCWETLAGYLARAKSIKNDPGGAGFWGLSAQMAIPVLLNVISSLSCCLGGLNTILFQLLLSLFCSSRRREGRREGMKRQLKAVEINSDIFPEENQFPSVGLKSFSKAKYSARRGGNCKKWFVRSSSPFLLSTSRLPSWGAGSNFAVSRLQTVKSVNTDLEQGKIQSFHLLGFEM